MLIRVGSAACVYLSQVLFARWMGRFEFGVYVYAWTWVLLLGELLHLGLGSVAQRFIPYYTQTGAFDRLRGFVAGSCGIVMASATAAALFAAGLVWLSTPWLNGHDILPLYFSCAALPAYAFSVMLDGIARSYNWPGLALLPQYTLRPLVVIVLMAAAYYAGAPADAATAMLCTIAATWAAAMIQLMVLTARLKHTIPAGKNDFVPREWLNVSLPILVVGGFYSLLTFTDILILQHFRTPDEVALYYAASKTLALVAFVNFSVAAASAHRFSEYHAAHDHERLARFVAASIRWTFWPSLAALAIVLALGRSFLSLFGEHFAAGYPLMFVLAAGVLSRAAVGPAERLLNMAGEQRACAIAYASAFAISLVLNIAFVMWLGALGAAIATSVALMSESILLFALVKRRLGIDAFIGVRAPV